MIQLLNAEIHRTKYRKIFYVEEILIIAIALLCTINTELIDKNDIIKNALTYGSVILPISFIPIYLYIWQVDFSSRFINNILISGVSRATYFLSKLCLSYIMCIILSVSYSLTILFSSGGDLKDVHLPHFFISMSILICLYLVAFTIGLMIYLLIDSVALSTIVYALFVLLSENLLFSILNQIGMNAQNILDYFIFQNISKAVTFYGLSIDGKISMLVGGMFWWLLSMTLSMKVIKDREFK